MLAAFHLDMVHFLMNRMQELEENRHNQMSIKLYWEMIDRRCRRCPLQQILGNQEFMGLEFYVNRHVLIPRQDTETLVELVLADMEHRRNGERLVENALLDLCTGSGCIAIIIAIHIYLLYNDYGYFKRSIEGGRKKYKDFVAELAAFAGRDSLEGNVQYHRKNGGDFAGRFVCCIVGR